ncbi:MAG: hypothetical protein A3E01_10730 [Gammaproteobacteria bacterium RIFCSPHIGHO2_12_FULL_63_22]|nr:MAG: hypothetical protein A3E01_10730 [Gammaproteobacteria bacterium RIFCSPHIGHO2_12_FULL_63_22]
MVIRPGSADRSFKVQIVDDVGVPVTGLVAATFPALYALRTSTAPIAFGALSDLAAIDSAHADGGVKEYSSGGGFYRVDAPDSPWATEDSDIRIAGEAIDLRVIAAPIDVTKGGVIPRVVVCSKTTGGTALQLQAWLEDNGLKVDLSTLDPAATCAVDVYQHGSGVAQFALSTGDFGSAVTRDVFEAEEADPNLTADRVYDMHVTITYLGIAYTAIKSFTAIP